MFAPCHPDELCGPRSIRIIIRSNEILFCHFLQAVSEYLKHGYVNYPDRHMGHSCY